MLINGSLQKIEKFEIQSYERPKNFENLKDTHVAFSGSPQKHPYDADKVILVSDPFSANTFYFEFNKEDISYVEELPSLVSGDGEAITFIRVWVKKMSIAVRCTPFLVEDTRAR